jgi:large subunit ribosomal protein L9
MDVILLERIGHLGQMGDVVRVKDGYARNFLLPSGKALRATDANRQKFERDRAMLEQRNAERRATAQGDAGQIDGKSFVLIRQAGESGQLYGSVSTRDIAEAASAAGTHVERNQVLLDTPIKTIGLHQVRIALHPEVVIEVTANVARSPDEAAAQARGEVLIGSASDREEARIAAEALFQQETESEAEAESTEEGVAG